MDVKLTEVVSDITGLTGMLIIGAILEGERDPIRLAELRHERCQHSEEQIALALQGTWRPEHLFELQQAHELYQFHHRQIDECDQRMEAELAKFPNRAGAKAHAVKPRKRRAQEQRRPVRGDRPVVQGLGLDLTLIEGIDVGTALVILGEIGVDVNRFPTEKHFASWLRLCPPQDESNKTNRRRGHRKATSRVTIALRMAAVGGPEQDAPGLVLPPHPQSDRRARGREGDRPQDGLSDLQDAQVRPGVRNPVDGGVRGQAERKSVESTEAEGARWASNSARCPPITARGEASPSGDRPLAMHNAEKPNSRASVRVTGGRGVIDVVHR